LSLLKLLFKYSLRKHQQDFEKQHRYSLRLCAGRRRYFKTLFKHGWRYYSNLVITMFAKYNKVFFKTEYLLTSFS